MTGSQFKHQIIILNEIVNKYLFSLQRERKLLFYLLYIGTEKCFQKYTWHKNKNKESLATEVIKQYYNYNNKKAKEALRLLTKEQIIDIAYNDLQWDEKQIKALKSELTQ